ncbi:MAG: citrate synthase [Vicinamibacteria bacterium]|nr:citrate synthase [Vicinamibacteria bacterium]
METPIKREWLDAATAARLLGVKRATLYAYASRGQVRRRDGERRGTSQYRREDLERLRERGEARAGHAPVAAGALRFGEPVLESAISGLGADGPVYRGQRAAALAAAGTRYEAVAELLWSGTLPVAAPTWPTLEPGVAGRLLALRPHLPAGARPLDAMLLALAASAVGDPVPVGRATSAELVVARRLIRALTAALALAVDARRLRRTGAAASVADGAALALLGRTSPRARAALDRALVLLADHELNASTFAARVAASAGTGLAAALLAALCTLTGARHGGECDRVEALVDEVGRPERAASAVAARLRRGEALPGFGHRLYPAGDPRTPPLLDAALALAPTRPRLRTVRALIDAANTAGLERPTVDVGLVALAAGLGLPAGAASALFALGRCAGWVAHVLEQREAGFLLRPRARYVGPDPS